MFEKEDDIMNIQIDNVNSEQNNNEDISNIKADKNTHNNFLSQKINLSEKNKNPKTYYCSNCNTFPEIKITNNNSLIFSCEHIKNVEINFKVFNLIVRQNESEEELKKKLICKKHSKVFECYCCDCKKNLCEDCYNDVEHNLKTEKENIYKYFKKMDEEIKYKEEFIENYFTSVSKNKNTQNYFNKKDNENEGENTKKIKIQLI